MILNNFEIVLIQYEDAAKAQSGVNAFIQRMNTAKRRIIDREEDVYTINGSRVYEFRFYVEILGDEEKKDILLREVRARHKEYYQ